MATVTTKKDVRTIALAIAERGRTGAFTYLAPTLKSLEVGQVCMLDSEDLSHYEGLSEIVASCADGVTLSKEARSKMRNVLSALQRETRKAHNLATDDTRIRLQSVYAMSEDDTPQYGVERIA